MHKLLSFVIAVVMVLALSTPSFAAKPVEKLKDGVTTVLKAPLEIKEHVTAEAKDGSFLPFSLPGGLLKGSFYMVKKMVTGALDIATFPIDK